MNLEYALAPAIISFGLFSSILLQFPDSWEVLQSTPFFSNVFSEVTYQDNWYDDPEAFAEASPKVVVQFIYEYQLSALLSRNYYS